MPADERTLFSFVDLKDPFMRSEVEGEKQPGPILALMSARQFDYLLLFHTPHTQENAVATSEAVQQRHSGCKVLLHSLPVSDPRDFSSVMSALSKELREIMFTDSYHGKKYACVSSGTAEMRTAWLLLTSVGFLQAKLLRSPYLRSGLVASERPRPMPVEVINESLAFPEMVFMRSLGVDKLGSDDETGRYVIDRLIEKEGLGEVHRGHDTTGGLFDAQDPLPDLENALNELGIFVGSAVLRTAVERAAVAARSSFPVLLLGETGTGKELFAQLIHRLSSRRDRSMETVNCAAIPRELAESYLFGHVKGAFTDAKKDQQGVFEIADKSTLFLDEVGELSLEVQAKLLRIVQDGKLKRLGSFTSKKIDTRLIAATNRTIDDEVKAGRFRHDLYHRLGVVHIQLPALRERRAEIAELAINLLKHINQTIERPRQLSKEALKRLEGYAWPGNVRELLNVLQRSVLFSRSEVLLPDDLLIEAPRRIEDLFAALPEPEPGFSLESYLAQVRKQLILRVLAKCDGNQSAAAELLGVSRQAVSKFLSGAAVNQD